MLAGGLSSRMGQDKATLRVGSESLLERQLRLLREAGAAELLVSLRPDSHQPQLPPGFADLRFVIDRHPGVGPIAGLEALLTAARHPLVLVLAVDLPAITPDFLTLLAARSTRQCGVIPARGPQLEPLAAIYPPMALEIARLQIQRGEFALTRFAERCLDTSVLRQWPLAPDEERLLTNWNRPDDWNPAARAVREL